MKKKIRFIKRVLFILPLTLILLFVFLPIGMRLTLLGFKDGDGYMFEAKEETYVIELSDKALESIHVEQSFETYGPVTLNYPSNSSTVRIDNQDTLSCEYGLLSGEMTCEEGTLSESEIETLKDNIFYHYFMINEHFNWNMIPINQR
jgi:hypothetical protein